MKILFITNAGGIDYMSDVIFHGGKKIYGKDFYETKKMWYMYDNLDIESKKKLYGRGFTISGKIDHSLYNELPGNVEELILNKFFDKIIYGSIWRCQDYWGLVSKVYDKKDILIIDGEDMSNIRFDFTENSTYFKRELYGNFNNVFPINFAVPEEVILGEVTEKKIITSDIIPDFERNYQYEYEEDYFRHYAECWFAITKMKGGWDCMRHYEIMMNGCVPIFENLENCPPLIMVDLPKTELIKFAKEKEINLDNNKFVLDYVKNNLTTKKIFNKILN